MTAEYPEGTLKAANIARVAGQLNKAWFPPNPAVISSIQEGLAQGKYENRREALAEDLRGDCSLYLLCLRELCILTEQKPDRAGRKVTHSELAGAFAAADIEELKTIFGASRRSLSSHTLDGLTRPQAERLEDCLVSATAAELLSPSLGVDSEIAYNTALLRQLGLTLIAWNYPNVYRQALDDLKASHDGPPTDLDTLIASILGFSPSLLGAKAAQCWGLADEVVSVIDAKSGDIDGLTSKARPAGNDFVTLLPKICAVGEALARASRPQLYPSAAADWETAERVVRHHLGDAGVQSIYDKAKELSTHYASFSPTYFDLGERSTGDAVQTKSLHGSSRLQANLFLKSCPSEVQSALGSIYAEMIDDVSNDLLRRFIHQTLPELGFDTACIFMMDPSSAALTPVLRVGNPLFVRAKPISLLDGSNHLNPVRTALSRRTPLVEEGLAGDVRRFFFVGSLGRKRGIGVMYLELALNAPSSTQRDPLLVFQACRHCLHDLLFLE